MSGSPKDVQADSPPTFAPGPTPMRWVVLWLSAVAILLAFFASVLLPFSPVAGSVNAALASHRVELSGASFLLAGGWKPTAAPAGVPEGARSYSYDGVTLTIWIQPLAGGNVTTAAMDLARQQFSAQVAAGKAFEQGMGASEQVRVGVPDEIAITTAVGPSGKGESPDAMTVFAYANGAPLGDDGRPAGESSTQFETAFQQVSAMMQSIEVEDSR